MVSRREFLRALSVAAAPAAPRPNILLILADDLGFECLGCYGGRSYRTPELDKMAADGVRFTHAFAQPLCTPTRLQLMTGKSNFRNWKAFGIMDPKERTFGHLFQENGYRTAIAGKWQFWSYNPPDFEPEWRGKGQRIENAGFEEYCIWHAAHTEDKGSRYGDPTYYENGKLYKNQKDKYGDDVSADFLLRFIDRHKAEPWFVYFPLALTHAPFTPTPRSADWNSDKRLKNDTKYFKDQVEYMDGIIGRMLRRLPDNTLVLFYGDNGTLNTIRSTLHRNGRDEQFQGGKGDTTEAGMRVPLIAWWKGRPPVGRSSGDLIDSCDFLPTMCEAAGISPKSMGPMDGRSFLPQIRGEKGQPREWIYSWYDPRPGHDKERWTRTERYVFDRRWKLYEDGKLYDWAADPRETTPIDNPAIRRKFQAVLARYKREEAATSK
ncbi:MAG TPA: sulfatase-like hydrolase/transferase [Bryobacteraceae bacterium]|nr:sulfatase-like hydrolase/transferase [Bryobacteraceae bacterium]